MKKLLLCTAMTMAFINFAHAKKANMDSFCPNKEALKTALKSHQKEATDNTTFTFKTDSQDGKGKNEEWKASDFIKKAKDANWENAANLEIKYKTKKKVNAYCEAQLHDSKKKTQFVIYLHKKEE